MVAKILIVFIASTLLLAPGCATSSSSGGSPSVGDYAIVDTQQTACYDNSTEIACPAAGEAFFGQDAQSSGDTAQLHQEQ